MTERLDSAELPPWLALLEAPVPAWTSASAAVVAAMMCAEAMQNATMTSMIAYAFVAALFAAAVTWRGAIADVVTALLPCAAIATTGPGAFVQEPFAPFFAQAHGQRVLLALRFALFFVALVRVRGKPRALAAFGALLLGSIVVRGLVVACAVAMPIAIRVTAARPQGAARHFPAAAALLVLAIAAIVHVPERVPSDPPASPSAATAYWQGRKNLFRAHAAAFQWARTEAIPGNAYLALAEIDFAIGHADTALRVLAKVKAKPASPDVARRANELLERHAP